MGDRPPRSSRYPDSGGATRMLVAGGMPEALDGLNRVQRRILSAAARAELRPDRQHRKSATLVGEVADHSHGELAVYDALVRMTQPHSFRYPLLSGQGNFGTSVDPPAAMRYTEVRLSEAGALLCEGLSQDMVDTGGTSEPVLLPAPFPNLLANGSHVDAGGVGLPTLVPSYNLRELLHLAEWAAENPTVPPAEWPTARFVPAPDFAAGGQVVVDDGCRNAVDSGQGTVTVRASVTVEYDTANAVLVVTDVPPQVEPGPLLAAIADLDGLGIAAVRDETSATSGLRFCIELSADADPQEALHALYTSTQLTSRIAVKAAATVDGAAKVMGVAEMLHLFMAGRAAQLRRRTKWEAQQVADRLELVEGLLTCAADPRALVELVATSETAEARQRISDRWGLTSRQAQAVTEQRLRHLTRPNVAALRGEAADLKHRAETLTDLLEDDTKLRAVMIKELAEAVDRLDDGRRTRLIDGDGRPLRSQTVTVQASPDGTVTATHSSRTAQPDSSGGLWLFTVPDYQQMTAVTADGTILRVPARTAHIPDGLLWAGPPTERLIVMFPDGRARWVKPRAGDQVTVTSGAAPVRAAPSTAAALSDVIVISRGGQAARFPVADLPFRRVRQLMRLKPRDRAAGLCVLDGDGLLVLLGESGVVMAVPSTTVELGAIGRMGQKLGWTLMAAMGGGVVSAAAVPEWGTVRVLVGDKVVSGPARALTRGWDAGATAIWGSGGS